jgi:hypothetical protein
MFSPGLGFENLAQINIRVLARPDKARKKNGPARPQARKNYNKKNKINKE